MKTALRLSLCLLVVLGLVGVAIAADKDDDSSSGKKVSLTGSIACGKCTLGKADACQDVLSVAGADGKTAEYWLVKNDVMEKFGHGCKGEKAATVTGTVKEKDGKMWLTASKVEPNTKG